MDKYGTYTMFRCQMHVSVCVSLKQHIRGHFHGLSLNLTNQGPNFTWLLLHPLCFPIFLHFVSHFTDFFPPPSFCLLLLLIVSYQQGRDHYLPTYTHIPKFIRIPKDPYDFRRFPWNLFQTSNSVRGWLLIGIISLLPISLGSGFTLTTFVISQRLADHSKASQVPSLWPWSLSQGWAHCDKAQG